MRKGRRPDVDDDDEGGRAVRARREEARGTILRVELPQLKCLSLK